MKIKGILLFWFYCFAVGTQTLGRSNFYWVTSGFPFNSNNDVTQRSGQIFVCRRTFCKTGKS